MSHLPDNFVVSKNPHCAVALCLSVISGRWNGIIIYHLLTGTKRFNELRKLIPGVTQRMLTAQLRELEKRGVIRREVFPVVPPHVEYSLTDFGKTLEPVITRIEEWGHQYHAEELKNARNAET